MNTNLDSIQLVRTDQALFCHKRHEVQRMPLYTKEFQKSSGICSHKLVQTGNLLNILCTFFKHFMMQRWNYVRMMPAYHLWYHWQRCCWGSCSEAVKIAALLQVNAALRDCTNRHFVHIRLFVHIPRLPFVILDSKMLISTWMKMLPKVTSQLSAMSSASIQQSLVRV